MNGIIGNKVRYSKSVNPNFRGPVQQRVWEHGWVVAVGYQNESDQVAGGFDLLIQHESNLLLSIFEPNHDIEVLE